MDRIILAIGVWMVAGTKIMVVKRSIEMCVRMEISKVFHDYHDCFEYHFEHML